MPNGYHCRLTLFTPLLQSLQQSYGQQVFLLSLPIFVTPYSFQNHPFKFKVVYVTVPKVPWQFVSLFSCFHCHRLPAVPCVPSPPVVRRLGSRHGTGTEATTLLVTLLLPNNNNTTTTTSFDTTATTTTLGLQQ